MGFASFMASAAGRWLRIVAGLALIGGGIFIAVAAGNAVLGIVLAAVGLIPLLAALADVCIFAPLFGAPFSGPKIRAKAQV
jgi:hypothetical protein